jgi:hypothetical protein
MERVIHGESEVGLVYGVAEVNVAGKVSMNVEFIEDRQTRDEVQRGGNSGRGNRPLQG